MTDKIITVEEAEKISKQERINGKSIILVGGCFDLIHKGHLSFLSQARKYGDRLFLLLESDEKISKFKGRDRPLNSQKYRAIVLSSVKSVNYIIPLEGMTKNEEYDKLIVLIQPNVIAMTKGDSQIEKRRKQCKLVDAELVLIDRLETPSTTELIERMK